MTCVLFAAVATLLGALPSVPAQTPDPEIRAIHVTGSKRLWNYEVVSISGLKVGMPATPETLDAARSRLLGSGWFGYVTGTLAPGAVRVTLTQVRSGTRVTIEVHENPVVGTIALTGAGPISPETIRDLLRVRCGRVLNAVELRWDVARIQSFYASKGYIATVLAVDLTERGGRLRIPVLVARIRTVEFAGAAPAARELARRAADLKSGDYYNVNDLRAGFTAIFNTRLFDDVRTMVHMPGPAVIDLTFELVPRGEREASETRRS